MLGLAYHPSVYEHREHGCQQSQNELEPWVVLHGADDLTADHGYQHDGQQLPDDPHERSFSGPAAGCCGASNATDPAASNRHLTVDTCVWLAWGQALRETLPSPAGSSRTWLTDFVSGGGPTPDARRPALRTRAPSGPLRAGEAEWARPRPFPQLHLTSSDTKSSYELGTSARIR
ncbi:hypothetical protein NKH18_22690 [Streptomyces sp. M10(2022)]